MRLNNVLSTQSVLIKSLVRSLSRSSSLCECVLGLTSLNIDRRASKSGGEGEGDALECMQSGALSVVPPA